MYITINCYRKQEPKALKKSETTTIECLKMLKLYLKVWAKSNSIKKTETKSLWLLVVMENYLYRLLKKM